MIMIQSEYDNLNKYKVFIVLQLVKISAITLQ